MAVTVTRQAGQGRASFSQGSQRSDSIVYTVTGLEVRALKSLISNGQQGTIGLPNYGDNHPELPISGMRARAFAISEEITGEVADVEVTYATSNAANRAGLLYATPDVSGTQFVWGMTFEDVEIVIPVAYRIFDTISDGNASKQTAYWKVEPFRVTESRAVIDARWTIESGAFDQQVRRAFEDEHNHIHTIGPYRYLFRVSGIRAIDNLNYEITCSWSRDKGTPRPPKGSPNTNLVRFPGATSGQHMLWMSAADDPANIWPNDGSLIRSPFHHLETSPGDNPGSDDANASCPKVYQFQDYTLGDITNLPEIRF